MMVVFTSYMKRPASKERKEREKVSGDLHNFHYGASVFALHSILNIPRG
jgi:hypothetical protein